ncbi:MAG: MFS transporter [Actinobacteria bacterium]|nr:MFS transporter [Actinomycetota bacterium]
MADHAGTVVARCGRNGPAAGTVPPVTGTDGATGTHPHEALQRRSLRVLMAGLIPAGAAMTGAYSAAAVLGEDLTGSELLGGLAASGMTTGSALAILPLARLMSSRGRRPGLLVGYLVAAIGATMCMLAAVTGWYSLLIPGMLGVGSGNAANLAARYAAADLAPEVGRARAIGTLVWASTIGAVVGPSIGFGPAKSLATSVGTSELAGPYMFATALFLTAALVVGRWLRPDPLVVAGGAGGVGGSDTSEGRHLIDAARTLAVSATGRLAALSMVVGHVVMVGVMTMTPLHLREGAHQLEIIGLVISLHIIGMYACAPIVGWLADRLGPLNVLAVGGMILFAGSEMAAHTRPEDSLGIFVGLFLIGLGWSFGLIASSALLVDEFDGPERVRVQGLADVGMTAAGALAGVGSGVFVTFSDYAALAHGSALVGLFPTVAVLTMRLRARRRSRLTT